MKGFWYQYPNIFKLVEELGIPSPWTEWTESNFYLPDGLLTEGPVFQDKPKLPTMLGQALYTFPLFKAAAANPLDSLLGRGSSGIGSGQEGQAARYSSRVNMADLASMMSLLPAMLAFDADEATYEM